MPEERRSKTPISELLSNTGLSSRPEYYSGRGATRSDLNSEILEKIFQLIKNNYGSEAATQYSHMVRDMEKLSATDFLISLYNLQANDWKWKKVLTSSRNSIYAGDYGSAFGTVMSVLGGMNNVDETESIRDQFLKNHKLGQRKRDRFCAYDERCW